MRRWKCVVKSMDFVENEMGGGLDINGGSKPGLNPGVECGDEWLWGGECLGDGGGAVIMLKRDWVSCLFFSFSYLKAYPTNNTPNMCQSYIVSLPLSLLLPTATSAYTPCLFRFPTLLTPLNMSLQHLVYLLSVSSLISCPHLNVMLMCGVPNVNTTIECRPDSWQDCSSNSSHVINKTSQS